MVAVRDIPWSTEFVLNSGALVDGYNDMPGGVMVESGPGNGGALLMGVYIRVANGVAGEVLGGSGTLLVEIFRGTYNSTESSALVAFTVAAGGAGGLYTLSTAQYVPPLYVLRPKSTRNAVTAGSLIMQFRGVRW